MKRRREILLFLLLVAFVFLSRGLYLAWPADKVFDEVHYVRAASFYLAGQEDPNWEHPPLGKMFIASGMYLFGDNSLGWRFFPYIFGCLIVILVYFLARILGFGPGGATIAGFLLSFDFLSFVQGRLAMLDVFLAFFILLALLFFARYYFSRSKLDFLLTLVASGLALASKWSALYVIFFIGLGYLFLKPFAATFKGWRRFLLNGFIVFISFVVVVGSIYLLSYTYYFSFEHGLGDWVKLHQSAWEWHTRPNIEHPYASQWWTWPLMTTGVWYYYLTGSEGKTAGILATGNPVLWYLGGLVLLGLLATVPIWIRGQNYFIPVFLLLGFGSNFFPWIISTKGGFIFYMLPLVPFYALALAYLMQKYWKHRIIRRLSWVAFGLTFIAFAFFYPLLSALPIYSESFLRAIYSGSFLHF